MLRKTHCVQANFWSALLEASTPTGNNYSLCDSFPNVRSGSLIQTGSMFKNHCFPVHIGCHQHSGYQFGVASSYMTVYTSTGPDWMSQLRSTHMAKRTSILPTLGFTPWQEKWIKLYQYWTISGHFNHSLPNSKLFQLHTTASALWLFSFLYLLSHTYKANTQIIKLYSKKQLSTNKLFKKGLSLVHGKKLTSEKNLRFSFWLYNNSQTCKGDTAKQHQFIFLDTDPNSDTESNWHFLKKGSLRTQYIGCIILSAWYKLCTVHKVDCVKVWVQHVKLSYTN